MRSLYSDPASLNIARLYGTEFVPMVVRRPLKCTGNQSAQSTVFLPADTSTYGGSWRSGAQSS